MLYEVKIKKKGICCHKQVHKGKEHVKSFSSENWKKLAEDGENTLCSLVLLLTDFRGLKSCCCCCLNPFLQQKIKQEAYSMNTFSKHTSAIMHNLSTLTQHWRSYHQIPLFYGKTLAYNITQVTQKIYEYQIMLSLYFPSQHHILCKNILFSFVNNFIQDILFHCTCKTQSLWV